MKNFYILFFILFVFLFSPVTSFSQGNIVDKNKLEKQDLRKKKSNAREKSARRLLIRVGAGLHTDYSNFIDPATSTFFDESPIKFFSSTDNWMFQGVLGLRGNLNDKPRINRKGKDLSVSNVLALFINYGNNTSEIIKNNKIFHIQSNMIGEKNTFYEIQGGVLLGEFIKIGGGIGHQTISYDNLSDGHVDYYIYSTGLSFPFNIFNISKKVTTRFNVDLSLLHDSDAKTYTSRCFVGVQLSKKIIPVVSKKTKKTL